MPLRGRAIGDEPAGEEPEAGQIALRMTENRQLAVEIIHRALAALERQFGGDQRRHVTEEG